MNPGHTGTPGPDDFDDLIDHLRTSTDDPQPTTAFRSQLRETLMTTTTLTGPNMGTIRSRPRAEWHWPVRGMRYLAYATTLALILTIATAGYLGSRHGTPTPTQESGALLAPSTPAVTPEASPGVPAEGCLNASPVLDRCSMSQIEGRALLPLNQYSPEQLSASEVQMQGWEVDPGIQVPFVADGLQTQGAAVDIVVGGAYQGQFDAKVTVVRVGGANEYPEPNTPIELARGDSVSYPIGTKVSMMNPLTSIVLKVKTVVIFAGADPGQQGATGEYRFRVDSNGSLPKPMADFENEVSFRLTYSYQQLSPEYLQSQGTKYSWWVLGPNASRLVGGSPGSGFILWVEQGRG
ncbi:MAG TPA: hypothetical protein PK819_07805 [Thermomicrobiales bacterium]|nr:hypothetical protein [Thermomicrobiales bacterium]